jgi:hypothetical protein
VQAVQDSLINVALDAKQPYWVRIRAAMVINHVGDEKTKARLKPLAVGEAENDPEDKLKGYALQAVYPDCMTTEEVFSRLTQPKAKYIGGSYQEFIARDFGSRLPLSDLPIALRWLEKQPVRH